MADSFPQGFRLITDATGVERLVWPTTEDGVPDLTAERRRQRREVAILTVSAEFGHELDDDGLPALHRCIHRNRTARCAKQGTKREDGLYYCAPHWRAHLEWIARRG